MKTAEELREAVDALHLAINELARLKNERDRYWEIALAAQDYRDLETMTGVPIPQNAVKDARMSLDQLLEEWKEGEQDDG